MLTAAAYPPHSARSRHLKRRELVRFSFLLAILLSLPLSSRAQLSIGISGCPAISQVHNKDVEVFADPIYALNAGLWVAYQTKRWQFSAGLRHLTQGGKTEVLETSENNQATGETFDLYFRARAIAIPLEVNYHFIQSEKSSFFAGTGVYTGYFYAQRQENTSIPRGGDPNTIINNPTTRFTDVNVFEDLYLGLNFGLGWERQLSKHLTLRVKPNFLYQLRTEDKTSNNAGSSRLMTYALELGMTYTFPANRGLY